MQQMEESRPCKGWFVSTLFSPVESLSEVSEKRMQLTVHLLLGISCSGSVLKSAVGEGVIDDISCR